jgi:hypothetical protein
LSENTLALLYAVAAGKITPPRQAGPLTALLMQLLRVEPAERPPLSTTRDNLQAVAEGRQPAGLMNAAAGAPTDRIAGNRLPPARSGPPPQQRPWPPQPPPSSESTRLDVHPFAEPTPSGPVLRDPAPTPPPRSGPPGQAARAKNDRVRSILLTVLAVVAAALVGILVASLLSSGNDDNDGQKASSPSTSSQQQPATATATSTTTTETTTTTTTTEAPAQPNPGELENAVRTYYSLLPADKDGAWVRMTAAAQEQGGGRAAYDSFWGGIAAVQVTSAAASGSEVAAALHFTKTDGSVSDEAYLLQLIDQDGQILINSFQKTG